MSDATITAIKFALAIIDEQLEAKQGNEVDLRAKRAILINRLAEEGTSNPNISFYKHEIDRLDQMVAALEEIKQRLIRDRATTLAELFQGKKS